MGKRASSIANMKLNISNPPAGTQKLIEIEDERKLRVFMDKKMSTEVPADSLGDEWKGYIVRITGGNDKQGFPMKQGEQDIPGLTDTVQPKRLGPKRATKIRRFFGLSKQDDVRKFVIRREVVPKKEGAKPYTKAPKIQRLVTPQRLQHKRHRIALKRRRAEASKDAANEYAQIMHKRVSEEKAKQAEIRKRRASSMRK